MQICYVFLCIVSLLITYEDLKFREVSLYLFILLSIIGVTLSALSRNSVEVFFLNLLINGLIALLLVVFLKFFYLIKEQKKTIILDEKIGKGDVVFIFCCSTFFSPMLFCLFLVSSITFSLLTHLFILSIKTCKTRHDTVPLAGLQAFFLIAFIYFLRRENICAFSDEEFIIRLLTLYDN